MRSIVLGIMATVMIFGGAIDGYAMRDEELAARLKTIETRLERLERLLDAGEAAERLEALRKKFNEGKGDVGKGGVAKKRGFSADRILERIKRKRAEKIDRSAKYLKVTQWSAGEAGKKSSGRLTVEIFFTLKNVSKTTISIVDGAVEFSDKLGEVIGRIAIKRDIDLAPGAEVTLGGKYHSSGNGLERLVVIKRQHTDVGADIDKLLLSSGEVVRF